MAAVKLRNVLLPFVSLKMHLSKNSFIYLIYGGKLLISVANGSGLSLTSVLTGFTYRSS